MTSLTKRCQSSYSNQVERDLGHRMIGLFSLSGFSGTRQRSSREVVAEHWKTAQRLLPRGLVLNDVPVLREDAVLDAHDVGDDPRCRQAVTGKPPVENDEITSRRRNVVLVAQCCGQALDQAKEPVAAGRNMCAVLDIVRRPQTLGRRIVALVEEGIERVQDDFNQIFAARFGWCGHGNGSPAL